MGLKLNGRGGQLVSVGELVTERRVAEQKSIYHKNLKPVVYVTADVAGVVESPVYAILDLWPKIAELELPEGYSMEQHTASQPFDTERFGAEVFEGGGAVAAAHGHLGEPSVVSISSG